MEKKKESIKQMLQKISNEKDLFKLLDLYKEILNINNTDREIVLQYLKLLKIKNEKEKAQPIEEYKKYINHLPKIEWNNNFSEIIHKNTSSLEKLELVLQKILSLNSLEMNRKNKSEIIVFLYKYINETKIEINNTSPITWENEELYIFFLFKIFMEQLKKKIIFYTRESNFFEIDNEDYKRTRNNILKLEVEFGKKNPKKYSDELKLILENQKLHLESIILCDGNFIKSYLINFNDFLAAIKDTFLNNLSKKKFDTKEDKYIFEYFMFYISNYNFENIPGNIIHVWENSFKILDSNQKQVIYENYKVKKNPKEFSIDKGNLKIVFSSLKKIEIKNIDDYDIESLFDYLIAIGNYNKNEYMKFIKIQKINNNLFVEEIKGNWISFNITIFNSKTIKSLFDSLFLNQDDSILDQDELYIIFDNILYFTFPTDFRGKAEMKIMKIYEYGLLIDLPNKDLSKLISFAFLLKINIHEILGYLNLDYQTYSNIKKEKIYFSPNKDKTLSTDYSKNISDKKYGENIEIKLYGKVIKSFTVKEALFVLNLNNYLCDYDSFRKNFMKCNNEKLKIDIAFQSILEKVFKINFENLREIENNCYSINVNKKFTDKDTYSTKGRHPIGYNIDGIYEDKSDYFEKLIDAMINLDKDIDLLNDPKFFSK